MSDCDICTVIATDGWNSTPWHHCRLCHVRWKGLNKGHCLACHETFSSENAFLLHWRKGGHVHPREVKWLSYNAERLCWQRESPTITHGVDL